jgi:hypothetical protein
MGRHPAGWRPDEELLAMLHDAVARDDDETYLGTLLGLGLVLPGDPDDGEWAAAPTDVGTVAVAFSSVELMRDGGIGAEVPYTVWPVLDLLHAWPDPAWSLLIDGGCDSQVLLEPGALERLAEQAAEAYPLDAALRSASGRLRPCLEALVRAVVVVPQPPGGAPIHEPSHPDFAWWHTGAAVALFSSPMRLQVRLGDVPWLTVAFTDVLAHWPDGCAATIDPDQPTGARLPAEAMTAMAVALRALSG